jgi:hypothetical protein
MTPTMEFSPDWVPSILFDRLFLLELLFAVAATALYLKLKSPRFCDVRRHGLRFETGIPNMKSASGMCSPIGD